MAFDDLLQLVANFANNSPRVGLTTAGGVVDCSASAIVAIKFMQV
ncbi:hypothetical protein D5b_00113 [Faustovirus]|nr:hypothetical protein D5b_00113 [Faustovirus]